MLGGRTTNNGKAPGKRLKEPAAAATFLDPITDPAQHWDIELIRLLRYPHLGEIDIGCCRGRTSCAVIIMKVAT